MEALSRTLHLVVLLAVLLVASASFAQDEADNADDAEQETAGGLALNETVYWDIQSTDETRTKAFREGVREALADAAPRHLLSERAFQIWVADRAPGTPSCFRGATDCIAPGAIVFDALGLSSLIHIELNQNSATYRVLDARGQAVREGELAAESPRKLGFAMVGEVFDATGVLTIVSKPEGATVEIDERSVGTTPMTYRVAIGSHTYTLRHPDHRTVSADIEVGSGRAVNISHNLTLLPGSLTVVDAPEGSDVYVNGKYFGPAGERIELEPGNYTIEIIAEGYETMRDAVTIEPGLSATRSAPLQESNPFLKDISSDAIIFNNYILRFGFEYGLRRATFQDARSGDDIPLEFAGFADEDGSLPQDVVLDELLGSTGLRFDASYGLKRFGIVILSLSYLSKKTSLDGFVTSRGVDPQPVTITAVRRLQVRPFQVFYRHFYKNFVPFLEGGIGIDFTWLQTQGAIFTGSETLRRTDALWTLAVGAQYYFNANFFGFARYSIQDYFEQNIGTDHQVSIGVGAAFPNLFGFATEPPDTL